jgi:hypothetical protein
VNRDVSRRSAAKADQILEQALKHELRRDAGATPEPALHSFSEGGCVDAETLAAWQDGGLDPVQMSSVETHVSSCAHCQAMLAAFARGTPGTPGTPGTLGTLGTYRWWLAPIAAGAAAVTIWMVVPDQQEIATRPAQPPGAAAVEPSREQAPAPSEAPAPLAAQRRDAERPADTASESKLRAEAFGEMREKLADAISPKEQAAVAPPATAAPAAPPAPAAAREEAAAAPAVAGLQKSARMNVAAPDIVSPDPSRRWRITDRGIEHSNDAGANWTLVRATTAESLTAGVAPSGSVLWLIGRAGVVLLTNDGANFARVDLPESVDLAAIVAADARTATVTTVDGRRFQTDDGGRSWRRIPA